MDEQAQVRQATEADPIESRRASHHATWGGSVDWMRLVDMAMGAVFGGGLVGTWLQLRHQRQVERNNLRERYGELLGDIESLITAAFAFRKATAIVGGIDPAALEGEKAVMIELGKRVHRPLSELANAHPSPQVRELSDQLQSALASYLSRARWLRNSGTVPKLVEPLHDERHAKVQQLLAELRERI